MYLFIFRHSLCLASFFPPPHSAHLVLLLHFPPFSFSSCFLLFLLLFLLCHFLSFHAPVSDFSVLYLHTCSFSSLFFPLLVFYASSSFSLFFHLLFPCLSFPLHSPHPIFSSRFLLSTLSSFLLLLTSTPLHPPVHFSILFFLSMSSPFLFFLLFPHSMFITFNSAFPHPSPSSPLHSFTPSLPHLVRLGQ